MGTPNYLQFFFYPELFLSKINAGTKSGTEIEGKVAQWLTQLGIQLMAGGGGMVNFYLETGI